MAPLHNGPIEWQLLSDGAMEFERNVIFANVEDAELATAGIEGNVTTPFNCLLIRQGDRVVLVDAGLGELAEAFGAPAGELPAALRAAGLGPEDVDDVVVTHGHVDHVGGLVSGGAAAYPRATHHLTKAEWDFWMEQEPHDRLPEDSAEFFVDVARGSFGTLHSSGQLELNDGTIEITEGVRLRNAPGHTPGHVAVELDNGGDPLLYFTDLVLHELQLRHLDWVSAIDVDPARAVQSRQDILLRASAEQTLVAGFHLPATGRLTAEASGYRLVGRTP